MHSRLTLHEALVEALGTRYVYFQPPEEVKMTYPAIRYQLQGNRVKRANNGLYLNDQAYMVTIIDEDPDSEIPSRVETIPYCRFDRFYIADNLNHWVYVIYVNKEKKS